MQRWCLGWALQRKSFSWKSGRCWCSSVQHGEPFSNHSISRKASRLLWSLVCCLIIITITIAVRSTKAKIEIPYKVTRSLKVSAKDMMSRSSRNLLRTIIGFRQYRSFATAMGVTVSGPTCTHFVFKSNLFVSESEVVCIKVLFEVLRLNEERGRRVSVFGE